MKKKIRKGNIPLFKKIRLQSTKSKILAICAPCLAACVAAVFLFTNMNTALAAESLPHIEQILNDLRGTGVFTITEIYQNESDRYFGYYINGQEPDVADWRNELAALDTEAERREFVDGLQTALSGVLGSADGAPLSWIGDYSENYPWEGTAGRTRILLNESEEHILDGVMKPADDGNPGEYMANFTPAPVEQNTGLDTDVLIVNYLGFGTAGEYYFDLSRGLKFSGGTVFPGSEMRFDEPVYERYEDGDIVYYDENGNSSWWSHTETETVDGEEIEFDVWVRYVETDTDVVPRIIDYTPYYVIDVSLPDEPGVNRAYPGVGTAMYILNDDDDYIYDATLGNEFILGKEYYVVTDYGLAEMAQSGGSGDYPAASHSGIRSVSDAVNPVDGARFMRVIKDYTYTGIGSPLAEYWYDDSEPGTVTVHCDVVYYSGGFVNNNWFLRHVFDREISELGDYPAGKIVVNSVRADTLTEETISHITNANLIVMTQNVNLSAYAALQIYNASTATRGLTPVVFPYSMAVSDADSPARQLARALMNKPIDPRDDIEAGALPVRGASLLENGVNGNIFWTNRSVSELLVEYPYSNPIGFEAVKLEIDDENFLRGLQGISESDMLRERIHNGTAVRYIINFSRQREMFQWTSINVLEIQGGLTLNNNFPASPLPESAANDSDLTIEKIRRWIGDPDGDVVKQINITRMTTYEFVGKIEDLNEEYHMIYIGGTARGMNPVIVNGQEESRYNDENMNGMVYTNIGDLYRANNNGGEGATLNGLVSGDGDRWFRLSGNDITPTKMQDIVDFVDAGYPVIIDDRLIRYNITGARMPTSPCPACGSTTNWENSSISNWGGGVGSWLQCGGTAPAGGYCGLQYTSWVVGATNNDHWGHIPGTYSIPEDAFNYDYSNPVINENRVDNSSHMNRLLQDIRRKPNVYSATTASNNPDAVRRYLNLSKPTIDWYGDNPYPRPYSEGSMTGNTLRYEFAIHNQAEAVPHRTTYDVELFLDLNGDGRYTEFEKQNDILVTRADDNARQSRNDDGRYTLSADVRYIVTKQLPDRAVGLFDWSLKVTKNDFLEKDNRSVRKSESGFAHIAPQGNPTEINILQIASSLIPADIDATFNYKGSQQRTNFEWQQRRLTNTAQIRATISNTYTNTNDARAANRYLLAAGYPESYYTSTDVHSGAVYYEGIYGKLMADVEDFKINIFTVYANELDDLHNRVNARPAGAETGVRGFLDTYFAAAGTDITLESLSFSESNRESSLNTIFEAFDMLIIGFDDSYGNLSAPAARAVTAFIDTGKAVLLAHDAISFHANTSDAGRYGMESTQYLRDAMNMDRFGITNDEFRPMLSGGNSNDPAFIRRLLEANYSVAWEPGSNRSGVVRETQGYSSHVLKWFTAGQNSGSVTTNNVYDTFMGTTAGESWWPYGSPYGHPDWNSLGIGRRTTQITQLNEGKITTYPYDVNIYQGNPNIPARPSYAPAGMSTVGETHGQWHTINMNLDDIVVWYCLASPNYIYNDGANNFYIYNSGNVTYTGAGHSMSQGNTTGRDTSRTTTHPSGSGTNTFNTNFNDNSSDKGFMSRSDYRLTDGIEFEAKLFVNTMIAAYRAAPERPDITVHDAAGTDIDYHLLPTDWVVLASEIENGNDDLFVYFTLQDNNLHSNKRIFISLSYSVGNSGEWTTIPASDLIVTEQGRSNTLANNRNGSLLSGVSYQFALHDNIISELNDGGRDGKVRLSIRAETTNVPSPYELVGYDNLTVQRLELFNLG